MGVLIGVNKREHPLVDPSSMISMKVRIIVPPVSAFVTARCLDFVP
jgi:hypothetical protein